MTLLVPDAGRLAEHAEEIKGGSSKARFKSQIRRIVFDLNEVILKTDYDHLGAIDDVAFAARCLNDSIIQARSFESPTPPALPERP